MHATITNTMFDIKPLRESNHGRTPPQLLTWWGVAGLVAGSRVRAGDCVEAAKLSGWCSLQSGKFEVHATIKELAQCEAAAGGRPRAHFASG